jgi:membrane-associated phospholipid phosphatase
MNSITTKANNNALFRHFISPSLTFLIFFSFQLSISQSRELETTGDIILYSLPLTALTATLLIKDREGTKQFAKGFLVNQALTFSLKAIVKKERPDGDGFDSFPSGHTSTAFQSAAFIQKRYGWKYGVPAFALAGLTGYSRINADRHDFTDVLFGTIIGIGSSYLFTTPYQRKHYQLTFSGGYENFAIGFRYNF